MKELNNTTVEYYTPDSIKGRRLVIKLIFFLEAKDKHKNNKIK